MELRLPQVKYWLKHGQTHNGPRAPEELLSHSVIGKKGAGFLRCRGWNEPCVGRGEKENFKMTVRCLLLISNVKVPIPAKSCICSSNLKHLLRPKASWCTCFLWYLWPYTINFDIASLSCHHHGSRSFCHLQLHSQNQTRLIRLQNLGSSRKLNQGSSNTSSFLTFCMETWQIF